MPSNLAKKLIPTKYYRGKILSFIIFSVIWVLLSGYVFMPTMSLSKTSGIYINLIIYFFVLSFIFTKQEEERYGLVSKILLGISMSIFGLLLFGTFISTSAILNSGKYRSQIGDVSTSTFTSNIQPVDVGSMIIVDHDIAARIGEKVLGSDAGLGSRVEIGEFTLQTVKGQLYWVAPLLHSGFWKWINFRDIGTPGFIMVSATNQDDYRLIKQVDGKDIKIKYQPNAWFSQYLDRHLYINGYSNSLYTDYTFEVDDNLNPYWTVTMYDTKIGLNGDDAVGTLIVSPETGEITKYNIEGTPSWVDRIQPEKFVENQIRNWGEYIHGYWNWSESDKLDVTSDNSIVLGHDGKSYYYFGLTSVGKDESTVGFVMVDTRTKKAHWFKQKGATESAARKSAEGAVQEKGYFGSDGITYNIDGYATYEFLLKDKAGLMKMIALVNVDEYNIVGVGETRQEAIQDYRNKINSRGNTASIGSGDIKQTAITGRVVRISSEVTKGNTNYKIIIDNKPNLYFIAGPTVSEELSFTKEGDSATITYLEDNKSSIPVFKFDNNNISLNKDNIKIKNEENLDTVRLDNVEKRN